MHKLIATLVCGLLAVSAQAQTPSQAKPQPREQAGSSANTAPIGQAVSGHNATAAGVSGTGLHTDGSATTGSAHGVTGQQAAGVDSTGKITGKSTAVVGVAAGKADNVNAQATNATPPSVKAGHKAKPKRKAAHHAAGGDTENR